MSTLPPGGSVYVFLLLSVQFSEKWIHIDLCYKGIWTNNQLTPFQCQTHSEFNRHWERPINVIETIQTIYISINCNRNKTPLRLQIFSITFEGAGKLTGP